MESLRKPSEVAQRLGVPVATLAQWRHRRIGPRFLKVGPSHVRYRDEDVTAWLESHAVATTADMPS